MGEAKSNEFFHDSDGAKRIGTSALLRAGSGIARNAAKRPRANIWAFPIWQEPTT
jgi:hypothetical protein